MLTPFVVLAAAVALATGWQQGAPMPLARSEVAATPFRGGVAVVGGFLGLCRTSQKVGLYLPASNRWRQLPALPVGLNHAAAASSGGKLYVAGGYGEQPRSFSRAAFVYDGVRWKRLRQMPGPRAAGGSAIVGGKWYIAGGVTPLGLADRTLVLDLTTGKWSAVPGPTPREHLGVAALGGKVYAVGGRLGGADANVDTFEVYAPATGRWERLPPVPEARGGTGLAAVGSLLVSVGGETTTGVIGSVYGYDVKAGAWRRLPDLASPRHGMAVAAVGRRVYAIGGAPVPGCGTANMTEYLEVGP
jgi:non-specific serine/threonine protein kinase